MPVPRTPQAFRRWPSCSTTWDRLPRRASSWGTSLWGWGWGWGRTKSEGGTTRDGRGTLWRGQPWDPTKPRGPSLALIPRSLTQSYQVHTLLGSAQPGRTLRTWSLNVPSAAAERPSAPSRRSPTVPALHGGLGEGAPVGDRGMLRTRLPGAPSAWPPPPRPWRLPLQPGVRDHPACLRLQAPQPPGTAAQGLPRSAPPERCGALRADVQQRLRGRSGRG